MLWAFWSAARRVSRIVLVPQAFQNLLLSDVDRSKVRVLPSGLDLELFKLLKQEVCCEQLGWDPDRFHFLFYNSGDLAKRPSLARTAIKAVQRLGVRAER